MMAASDVLNERESSAWDQDEVWQADEKCFGRLGTVRDTAPTSPDSMKFGKVIG